MTGDTMSNAGSGVYEQANQSRLGFQGGLKRQELKREREYSAMCFSSINAREPVPVVTQNRIINLKMSIMCLP